MSYSCPKTNEANLTGYFMAISTKEIITSDRKNDILELYGHCMECEDCRKKYNHFKSEIILDKGAIFDNFNNFSNDVCLSFDLFLKNEKILAEVLFRN